MPVMILLKHGAALSIAVINRRQNKVNADKDVLEKVTLIRHTPPRPPRHSPVLRSLRAGAPEETPHSGLRIPPRRLGAGLQHRAPQQPLLQRTLQLVFLGAPAGPVPCRFRTRRGETQRHRPHPPAHPPDLLLVPQGKGRSYPRETLSPRRPRQAPQRL